MLFLMIATLTHEQIQKFMFFISPWVSIVAFLIVTVIFYDIQE